MRSEDRTERKAMDRRDFVISTFICVVGHYSTSGVLAQKKIILKARMFNSKSSLA
jgi:hypothetical protein